MRRQIRGFWIAGSMIAAATLLSLHPVIASPRLISLAFNSQLQAPQQFGSDEFRQKLLTLAGKRFVVDQRGRGDSGTDHAILCGTRTRSGDLAVMLCRALHSA